MRFKIVLLILITLCWYGLGTAFVEGSSAVIDLVPRTYSLGGFPRAASLSDIDSDGDLDIIVTNPDKHGIVILLNKGDSTFEISNHYPIDGYPISIISTDIDGDSDIDLVVLDSDGRVRILFNDRKGLFSVGGFYPVEPYAFSISPSDMDLDGDPDIIVLSEEKTTSLLNDGKGGFDVTLSYPAGVNPAPKITADLNSDKRGDIVIGGKDGISVLLNNGDNTFAQGVYYTTGKMPVSVIAGDLDSDLDNDLVVANYKSHTISILKNTGDGTFQGVVDFPSPKGPNSITLGDIDLDEDLDIVVTNGLSGELSIFINNTVRPLAITTDLLPQGRRSLYYSEKLKAKGGVPPYNWVVLSGSLPPSLHLDPLTGEIASRSEDEAEGAEAHHKLHEDIGEPLISHDPLCLCLKAPTGLYRFTVQATDSSSSTATADLYIEVLPLPGTISGTINYSGNKKGTIRIGLWASSQSPFMRLFIRPIFSATVTTHGEYKVDNIYPESYLLGAYLDINGDGMRQMDEPYGIFGSREKPEAVVVEHGAALSDIDMELSED